MPQEKALKKKNVFTERGKDKKLQGQEFTLIFINTNRQEFKELESPSQSFVRKEPHELIPILKKHVQRLCAPEQSKGDIPFLTNWSSKFKEKGYQDIFPEYQSNFWIQIRNSAIKSLQEFSLKNLKEQNLSK